MASFKWRTVLRVAALVILLFAVVVAAPAQKPGQFSGDLVLKALPDGRTMELVQPF